MKHEQKCGRESKSRQSFASVFTSNGPLSPVFPARVGKCRPWSGGNRPSPVSCQGGRAGRQRRRDAGECFVNGDTSWVCCSGRPLSTPPALRPSARRLHDSGGTRHTHTVSISHTFPSFSPPSLRVSPPTLPARTVSSRAPPTCAPAAWRARATAAPWTPPGGVRRRGGRPRCGWHLPPTQTPSGGPHVKPTTAISVPGRRWRRVASMLASFVRG